MTNDTLLIAGIVAAIVALSLLRAFGRGELSRLKVRPRPLMTRAEHRVIGMIERAMPGCRVHAQVSMGALMSPAKHLSKSEWWTTFNKFSSKRIDFAVEDRRTGRVVLLVELDDRTHKRRADRDRDGLTSHAGYTTVRLPAGERPTPASVAARIDAALGREPDHPPVPPARVPFHSPQRG